MRFVITPDKFKDCLAASDVADSIAEGIRLVLPSAEIIECPMADGGDGTLSAILSAGHGRTIECRVTGPLPEMKVDAKYVMLDNGSAVIEMAAASGLALLAPNDRDPLNTTTFGTGELIASAIKNGAKKIIVGMGGSAALDGGIGCAQACGFTVLMRDGQPTSLTEPLCGRDVANVLMIKKGRGEITAGIEVIGARDVLNPLTGDRGAARSFGGQKGATPATIEQLEHDLQKLVQQMGAALDADAPGAGAAGGLGFAIIRFFVGTLIDGFDFVAAHVGLHEHLSSCDLCITGEGFLDEHSFDGKVVGGVSKMCRDQGVPCIAIVGASQLDPYAAISNLLTAYFSICDRPMSLINCVEDAQRLLKQTSRNCISLWASGEKNFRRDDPYKK